MSLGLADQRENGGVENHEKSSDVLLSLAAHELRTPLSVIRWYAEMLLGGDCGQLTDDQAKYLKIIQSSNQRAIDLIGSILNVSRLDLGTFSVRPEDVELESILKQTLADLKGFIEEKKVSVEESYGTSIPHISLDRNLCAVIFRNLISNAIRFSKERGSVQISVKEMRQGEECGGKTLEQDSLVVAVADSGIGIPEKDKQYVFSKPFYRGSNVTDEHKGGSGLGLYMTKLIFEKTQGEVWFISNNNGTTFYVAFPRSGMQKREGKTTLD